MPKLTKRERRKSLVERFAVELQKTVNELRDKLNELIDRVNLLAGKNE